MKTIRIRDFNVGPHDKFMFDTNIWILLYGSIAGFEQKKQERYASLLKEILSRKANIYVTSIIVSEYINVVLHIGFKKWKKAHDNVNADFKHDYRPTEHYLDILQEAVFQVKEILSITQKRPDDFHRIDIASMLDELNSNYDYNDAYIVKCCEQDNLTLVSDDTDLTFVDSKITLLTK
jgi:predicted nucleic acid-binding protein|nr:MAG TPA: 23S rRNA-specific endonuclease [Caudoviricetes sp.]